MALGLAFQGNLDELQKMAQQWENAFKKKHKKFNFQKFWLEDINRDPDRPNLGILCFCVCFLFFLDCFFFCVCAVLGVRVCE